MKKYLAGVALAAALAQPAAATTFPSLTTIYVGAGVRNEVADANTGIATAFNCSNVSGQTASVRFLVINFNGSIAANVTVALAHGVTHTAETHPTTTFNHDTNLAAGGVFQGVVNIESTQSAVFCNAVVLDAADAGDGFTLPLVRVNPHPGTVE